MVDTVFIGQLIDSMDSAVSQLEQAIESDKKDEANKLKTFVFDLHVQINKALESKDV